MKDDMLENGTLRIAEGTKRAVQIERDAAPDTALVPPKIRAYNRKENRYGR